MKNYVERVIKQINGYYSSTDEGIINWNSVEDDFFNNINKSEIIKKYGFSKFQYKILREYITGK